LYDPFELVKNGGRRVVKVKKHLPWWERERKKEGGKCENGQRRTKESRVGSEPQRASRWLRLPYRQKKQSSVGGGSASEGRRGRTFEFGRGTFMVPLASRVKEVSGGLGRPGPFRGDRGGKGRRQGNQHL